MHDVSPNEAASAQLIARVAKRVRGVRKERGWPRRILSEKSGVSPRYLAQLEAGEGNISIGLLQRVALALDVNIDALISETPVAQTDVERVALLYRNAPKELRTMVRNLLAPLDPSGLRAQRVCLVGLRGAGKSTLGRLAGEALGVPFVELNKEIEAHTGMPLSEVLALYGQDGYRALEAEAITRVVDRYDRLIMAVAGGIVSETDTYAQLLERFHTVWIKATPTEHMQRVRAQGDERPMQGNPVAMEQLKAMLAQRMPLYEQTIAQVNTSTQSVSASLKELIAVINANGFLAGPTE
jgi:XRE family aerobic/anaerobic benzoate catabolism transcriptional regulator